MFQEKGYKMTPQRLVICEYILSRKNHPTANDIHQALKEDYPTISMGTIYNTVHLLRDLGLLVELGFNEGSTRYDSNTRLHINIVCTNCGKIYDAMNKKVEDLWSSILNELDITPERQRIDIYYRCEDYRSNENNQK